MARTKPWSARANPWAARTKHTLVRSRYFHCPITHKSCHGKSFLTFRDSSISALDFTLRNISLHLYFIHKPK
ncbi:ribosomal large subunit pseudouridine synthase D [Sporosarcina newyorkensis 2681]|uniref:Ribosomal large subunit pseudouridine synthase D n=1 Tax=Sporosarcina newyorkensis 2681 TaxID=1027292 RepID=F9DQM8_9BACL|nr:ribosomal large subunit pseudouridine synthase D [Sporosarcina newyorkensis 2681]